MALARVTFLPMSGTPWPVTEEAEEHVLNRHMPGEALCDATPRDLPPELAAAASLHLHVFWRSQVWDLTSRGGDVALERCSLRSR